MAQPAGTTIWAPGRLAPRLPSPTPAARSSIPAPGATTQGNNSFNWNGQDNNGNQLADGTYTLTVAAADASGAAITSTVTSAGQVSEINMTSGTPQLVVGIHGGRLSAIANVHELSFETPGARRAPQTEGEGGRSPKPLEGNKTMSLYGALNIGVAGLNANSQALSATSSNIANVNTVGYKDATASFSTFLNPTVGARNNASAGVTADHRPGRDGPGPAHHDLVADRPVDLGQRLFRGQHRRRAPPPPRNIPAPAASRRTPSGNLVNSSGLYLMGYKLDSTGNVAGQHQRPQPGQCHRACRARRRPRPTSRCRPICSPARRSNSPIPRATWRPAM